jgi:hypothetical protein
MEAELQAQIPGLDRVISDYSVVSTRLSVVAPFGIHILTRTRAI